MISLTPFYTIGTTYSTRRMWYVSHVGKNTVKIFDTHSLTLMFLQHKKTEELLSQHCRRPVLLPLRLHQSFPPQPDALEVSNRVREGMVLTSSSIVVDVVIFILAVPLSIAEAVGGRTFVPPLFLPSLPPDNDDGGAPPVTVTTEMIRLRAYDLRCLLIQDRRGGRLVRSTGLVGGAAGGPPSPSPSPPNAAGGLTELRVIALYLDKIL